MIARLSSVLLALALAAFPQGAPPTGSISGRIADPVNNAPVPGVTVSTITHSNLDGSGVALSPASETVSFTSDAQGRYKLSGLPPGRYLVFATANTRFASRVVSLGPGQDLSAVDLEFPSPAAIAGRVLDENGEPVPHASVSLLTRRYESGILRVISRATARADDRGVYEFDNLDPGLAYLLLAQLRNPVLDPVSHVPIDPKARKPTAVPSFYPSADSIDAAAPVVPLPGQRLEGIDIRLPSSPSRCLDAALDAPQARRPLHFLIQPDALQVSAGLPPLGGVAPSGGGLRICGLAEAQYRLEALQFPDPESGIPPLFGASLVLIGHQDVRGVRVVALPGIPLPIDAAWQGDPPDHPPEARVSIDLTPSDRIRLSGETLHAALPLPGSFNLPSVLMGPYLVRTSVTGPRLYIASITYGGNDVSRLSANIGAAASGAVLHVTVASGGGSASVTAVDHDGKPIPNATVAIFPTGASSEAELAASLNSGQADQYGAYASPTLPPSSYYLYALPPGTDLSVPATLSALFQSRRAQAHEIAIAKNQDAALTLEVAALP